MFPRLQNFQSSLAPGVLKDEIVDFELVEVTGLETFNGYPDVMHELPQLLLVIGRNCLASGSTI